MKIENENNRSEVVNLIASAKRFNHPVILLSFSKNDQLRKISSKK